MTQTQIAADESFRMIPNGSVIKGKYQDVCPGRPGGAIDLTTLEIYRDHRVQSSLDRWGNYTIGLSNLQWFKGPQGSAFVLRGQFREANGSFEQWSFVISPDWMT